MTTLVKPRSSRRLFTTSPSSAEADESTQLVLPSDCELVAGTFVVFRWEGHCCVLQVNVTLYCWGRQRSGAIEHVLDKYGLTHSLQLYRLNSRLVSGEQWSWLKQVFVVVHRLFDHKETCETVSKVRWINLMQCGLAYDVMRRECHYYHRNLYPKGSVFTSFLKLHGVEVEPWFELSDASADRPTTPLPPLSSASAVSLEAPMSGGSDTSSGGSHQLDTTSSAAGSTITGVRGDGSSRQALGDREWLSDIHLANLMFLLLYGQLPVPVELRDVFQCIYPMTDQLLEQMLRRADAGSLLMHAKMGHGVTLVFVNPNNNHWRLVVLDGVQRQVTLFDPMGTPLPSSLRRSICEFLGAEFEVTDTQSCLQAEGWNCGIWTLHVASKYVTATVEHLTGLSSSSPMRFHLCREQDDYAVLDELATTAERQQNQRFADELRRQYSDLLVDARASGRLLYNDEENGEISNEELDVVDSAFSSASFGATSSPSPAATSIKGGEMEVVRPGSALSAIRRRRFIDRPLAEQVWIDLTDGVGTVEAEQEEAMETSYEELCDQYIEFREDNVNQTCAAALRYSLPVKLQSALLRQQIVEFREYRRQRFSLFRKGPLVEESTVAGNISALLRFLGYLHYEHSETLNSAPLDMSVFTLPTINVLVLSYVEWLEQRRGNKRQAVDDTAFQAVSCATVANYLNGLVSIVKFQLREDLRSRDHLLDQLRNLRSQAESYSMTQKRFEKVHPAWCSWQELQVAREKCRSAFDSRSESEAGDASYLLHLRELCALSFFTICPPPRCSILRLLEWNKTLVKDAKDHWVMDLTDLSHAATRHKTHKKKGALLLPLPAVLYPYLTRLRQLTPDKDGAVFPVGLLSCRVSSATSQFMAPTGFTLFVKTTFGKYTENGKTPNPSLLRSIFTTWLYGLQYDSEDKYLQEIKASSAQYKAHSEVMARTVYNKELVYQAKQFAQLLMFCERYSERFAYDRRALGEGLSNNVVEVDTLARRRSRRKRSREPEHVKNDNSRDQREENEEEEEEEEYVVEALTRIRINDQGEKQVRVRWEGYRRETWEAYASIKLQLPEMVEELEAEHINEEQDEDSTLSTFVREYIERHKVDRSYRWRSDRLNVLELEAGDHRPPIKKTAEELRKRIMGMVSAL